MFWCAGHRQFLPADSFYKKHLKELEQLSIRKVNCKECHDVKQRGRKVIGRLVHSGERDFCKVEAVGGRADNCPPHSGIKLSGRVPLLQRGSLGSESLIRYQSLVRSGELLRTNLRLRVPYNPQSLWAVRSAHRTEDYESSNSSWNLLRRPPYSRWRTLLMDIQQRRVQK